MSSMLLAPDRYASLESQWEFLEAGVDRIMNKFHIGLSRAEYMSLYTSIYDQCRHVVVADLYPSPLPLVFRPIAQAVYDNLTRYLITHLIHLRESLLPLEDGPLLRYYSSEWLQYTTSVKYIHRIFEYLNRHWVQQERGQKWQRIREGRDDNRKWVYPVYTQALAQWRNNLFIPIQQTPTNITSAILRLIEKQRNGEAIDLELIKLILDSFVSLGVDDDDTNKECLDVYLEHFEVPFLDATENYYTQESQSFLLFNALSDYLRKAQERLEEEADRADRYLKSRTRKPLIARCEQALIQRHVEVMRDNFQRLLDNDREEDMQRMVGLLARIPKGLMPLRKIFEEHVKKAGWLAVERLAEGQSLAMPGGNTAADELDLNGYINVLWEVHKKYSEIVVGRFMGEKGFVASLDHACREIVNQNAVIGLSNVSSPELLAIHADLLLRKHNKVVEEEGLEVAFGRVMTLFKYIEDKDVFQTFYATKLSMRLIHGISAFESEASMISGLKDACGFGYTNKLQRMFTDVSLSKDITDGFKAQNQNHNNVDISFSIMVLGTNFWPLSPPADLFVIPSEVLTTYDRFQKYYKTKHSGRKLTWLWDYSKSELRTNYTRNRKYIFVTSAYQMGILLLYNKSKSWGFLEIKEATGLGEEALNQTLGSLVRAKVLIYNDTVGNGQEGKEDGRYHLNLNFHSKRVTVNLNLPLVAERGESLDVLKAVEEERKYVIQAAIVRIMKARQTLHYEGLIQEVISQVSETFVPKVRLIKRAIDMLLLLEYIERVEGSRNTLAYVA